MQALEKQVGELRIDPTNESYEAALGDAGDSSRPSSGSPDGLDRISVSLVYYFCYYLLHSIRFLL